MLSHECSQASSINVWADYALMMINLPVDALVSAMDDLDRPEKDILMIISGAESILYPISLLMFRNYTVFLIVPDESKVQSCQATRVFSWCTDVLGIGSNPNLEPTANVGESPKVNGWVVNENHIPQLDLSNTGTAPPSIRSAVSSPNLTTTTTTTPASTPKIESRPVTVSEPPVSRAQSALSSNTEPPANKRVDVAQNGKATSNPKPSALEVPNHVPKSPDALAKGTTKLEDNPSDDWGQLGGNWSTGGGWEMTGASWYDEPAVEPAKIEPTKAEPAKKKEAKPVTPKNPQSSGRGPRPAQEARTSVPNPEITKASSDPPLSVFDPLLAILRGAENQLMLRSQLGEYLAKRDPNRVSYQNAGVRGLSEYLTLARQQNLVVLYGIDNHQQVKLRV